MADPFTLAAVSIGASALGGVTSTVGSVMQGNAQSSMYKYQAGVARINKDIAMRNAAYARYAGEFEAQRSAMKSRQEIGQTVVTQSGRGIDINSGSAADVRDSASEVARQEERTIRSNAARRAYGYEVEGFQEEAKARMSDKAASRSKLAGYIGAGSSLLGGASSVSSKWLQAQQAGIFSGDVALEA